MNPVVNGYLFLKSGKDKAAKGDGWDPPLTCAPTASSATRLWETFTFYLSSSVFHTYCIHNIYTVFGLSLLQDFDETRYLSF